MNEYNVRPGTLKDLDFLVETIVEAEKSGTDVLTYTTIFGLSEKETKTCIAQMLEEEVDDCDFSVSGFLIAEKDGKPAAALNSWIEGINGVSAATLKGNLFSYYFPKESLLQAKSNIHLISDLSIHYIPGTLWLGYGYVAPEYRGSMLLGLLTHCHIRNLKTAHPEVREVYCPMFGNNTPSIQNFKLLGFDFVKEYFAGSKDAAPLVPSTKKILMKKTI